MSSKIEAVKRWMRRLRGGGEGLARAPLQPEVLPPPEPKSHHWICGTPILRALARRWAAQFQMPPALPAGADKRVPLLEAGRQLLEAGSTPMKGDES